MRQPTPTEWWERAVRARNALSQAFTQLRGGHDVRTDDFDLALAELDIVLALARAHYTPEPTA